MNAVSMVSQSGPGIGITDRIHLIADLACSLARSCAFSRDPQWFWNLAETEIDAFCAAQAGAGRAG